MKDLISLLPLIGIALVFWLFIIRPTQRRQRDQRNLQAALQVGDRVMLTSGIFGVIEAIDDDILRLRVSEGVVVEVARGAVATQEQSGPSLDKHDQ